jgi:hypothetical protein
MSIVNPTRSSNFSHLFYFWDSTLHVSNGLSVHHQEFKTVHTATGIRQTSTATCLLASRQQCLFDIYLLLYVQSWTPDDGRKDRPKHVECYPKNKINLRSCCILLDLPQKYIAMDGPVNIKFFWVLCPPVVGYLSNNVLTSLGSIQGMSHKCFRPCTK